MEQQVSSQDQAALTAQHEETIDRTLPGGIGYTEGFIENVARVCHQANKGICEAQGDRSQVDWRLATLDIRESAIRGVRFALANPRLTPKDQHEAWAKDKVAEGWKYGPAKDPVKKEHPCLVRYEELPEFQKVKDHVFRAIVLAMGPPLATGAIPVVE